MNEFGYDLEKLIVDLGAVETSTEFNLLESYKVSYNTNTEKITVSVDEQANLDPLSPFIVKYKPSRFNTTVDFKPGDFVRLNVVSDIALAYGFANGEIYTVSENQPNPEWGAGLVTLCGLDERKDVELQVLSSWITKVVKIVDYSDILNPTQKYVDVA